VVTSLFASGTLDLGDVARFVGHSDTSTTTGYVQPEGDRPRQISERAFELLDRTGLRNPASGLRRGTNSRRPSRRRSGGDT